MKWSFPFFVFIFLLSLVENCSPKEPIMNSPKTNPTELETNLPLRVTLERLHKESRGEIFIILKGLSKGIFRKLQPEDMKDAYIAVSEEQGRLIFNTAVENKAKNIVEFGTSFGISTLYLAAAAKVNGGKVITTEILPEKVKVANRNFEEAKMSQYIELREGDAMVTLKNAPDNIDYLLLDGWKDLYVPLMKILEPKFKDGCIIVADNINFPSAKPYLEYIRNNKNYKSAPVDTDKGGTKFSVYNRDK